MTTQMTSGGEMAGVELVCRLMAATPPYLYNPNGPPHCFFFSDLLRGLVAKRCATSPPADSSVSPKRIRIASIGSAFSAKSGSRDEVRLQVEHRSTNPLSPSCVLPRLALLYRKLHEMEKETEVETNHPALDGQELIPTDHRLIDKPAAIQIDKIVPFRPTDRQSLNLTDTQTEDASPFSSVKHEAKTQKIP